MFMHKRDMVCWPKCTDLIQHIDHKLKANPKLRSSFMEACTADDQFDKPSVATAFAEKALRWSTGPLVEVSDGMIQAVAGGETGEACGYAPPFFDANTLLITCFWFDAFEFGIDEERDRNETRLIRTLLHEAVHWVRDKARASDEIQIGGFKGRHQEAGHRFEDLAFGSPNVCTDDEIMAAMTTMPPSGEKLMRERKLARKQP